LVDTTGAGDSFTGAYAVALLEGKSTKEALDFACKAAFLTVSKLGAS
jgi:ribokinase